MSACPIRDKDSRSLVRERKQRDSGGRGGVGYLRWGWWLKRSSCAWEGERERENARGIHTLFVYNFDNIRRHSCPFVDSIIHPAIDRLESCCSRTLTKPPVTMLTVCPPESGSGILEGRSEEEFRMPEEFQHIYCVFKCSFFVWGAEATQSSSSSIVVVSDWAIGFQAPTDRDRPRPTATNKPRRRIPPIAG